MNSERWNEVEKIFQSALGQPEHRRVEFLKNACGGDVELRREVESLLEHFRTAGKFMGSNQESLIGKTFGPYEILATAGADGMGQVYKARDSFGTFGSSF